MSLGSDILVEATKGKPPKGYPPLFPKFKMTNLHEGGPGMRGKFYADLVTTVPAKTGATGDKEAEVDLWEIEKIAKKHMTRLSKALARHGLKLEWVTMDGPMTRDLQPHPDWEGYLVRVDLASDWNTEKVEAEINRELAR